MKYPITFSIALALCAADPAHGQWLEPQPLPTIEIEPMLLVDTIRLDSSNVGRFHTYHVKNTGTAPLIITRITSSDPCMCDRWPKEPLGVGMTGELRVACPPMSSTPMREQSFFIESNAKASVIFKLRRVGVGSMPVVPER